MREYKHINDCWNAFDDAKNPEDVQYIMDDFPRWSGDWDWYEKDGEIHVVNTYFDRGAEEYIDDERILDNIMTEDTYWDGLL